MTTELKDSIKVKPSKPKYVELNRRYIELPITENDQETNAATYGLADFYGNDKGQPFSDFGGENLCVYLGEARSGKTTEFRENSKKLKQAGKKAFFLKIENLTPSSDALGSLKAALDTEDLNAFEEWLKSDEEAYFFLDAVDEAKLLGASNFQNAIKVFERAISNKLDKVRLNISCRTTEWRSHEDAKVLNDLSLRLAEVKKDKAHKDFEPDFTFKLLHILPLDNSRIKIYAQAISPETSDAFIKAIELANAADFSGRPGDISGLLKVWNKNGTLGTLTDIVKTDITQKVEETNEAYRRSHPLTLERTLEGLETLAAASFLCKQNYFSFLPDEGETEKLLPSISPFVILNDWKAGEVEALLRCSVFDDATYGRVRFHTRTVYEFLTANWIYKAFENGLPPKDICDLLFFKKYGEHSAGVSSAKIAAWLATKIPQVFEQALKSNPETLMDEGDPSKLSNDKKKEILEAYRRAYNANEMVWFRFDDKGLARFANTSLVPVLNSYLSDDKNSDHFREFILDLVEAGRLDGCKETVLNIVLNPSNNENVRVNALRVLEKFGEQNHFQRLFEHLDSCAASTDRFYGRCLWSLYEQLPIDKFFSLVIGATSKISAPQNHVRDWLNNKLEKVTDIDNLQYLVTYLVPLIKNDNSPERPSEEDYEPMQRDLEWLYSTLFICLNTLVKLSSELTDELYNAIRFSEAYEKHSTSSAHIKDSVEHSFSNASPKLRKAFFERRYAELENSDFTGNRMVAITGYYSIFKIQSADLIWLKQIAKSKINNEYRRDVFFTISQYSRINKFYQYKDFWNIARIAILQKNLFIPFVRSFFPTEHSIYYYKVKLERKFKGIKEKYWDVRRKWQMFKIAFLPVKKGPNAFVFVIYHDIRSRIGRDSYEPEVVLTEVENKHGKLFAKKFEADLLKFWKTWQPSLDRITTGDFLAILSFTINIERGLSLDGLASDQIIALTNLAFKNIGLPKWFKPLAIAYPETVKDVFAAMLKQPPVWDGDNNASTILTKIRYYDDGFWADYTAELLLPYIEGSSNPNPIQKDHIIEILWLAGRRQKLLEIARDRLSRCNSEERPYWLAQLLFLDAEAGLVALNSYLSSLATQGEKNEFLADLGKLIGPNKFTKEDFHPEADFQKLPYLEELIKIYNTQFEMPLRTRHGAYTPDKYDDTSSFVSALTKTLSEMPGEEAYKALKRLAEVSPPITKDYLNLLAKNRALADVEKPWDVAEFLEFKKNLERDPANADELFLIGIKRLVTIKDSIEHGDYNLRKTFLHDTHENEIQKLIARDLRNLSKGRYSEVREAHVADEKEPDIRLINNHFPEPVSIEIKLAHRDINKTIGAHKKHIVDQLISRYLRPLDSNHGIYLVVNAKEGFIWKDEEGNDITFDALCSLLNEFCKQLSDANPEIHGLTVIGIDLWSKSREIKLP